MVDAEVREVDWIQFAREWEKDAHAEGDKHRPKDPEEDDVDLIVCADCIYNPSISIPLARTLDYLRLKQKRKRKGTTNLQVLVASELRDSEPLESFLTEWLSLGWKVDRVQVGENDLTGSGLGDKGFVVWIGSNT